VESRVLEKASVSGTPAFTPNDNGNWAKALVGVNKRAHKGRGFASFIAVPC
jgi:hypothetical protein